MKKFRNLQARIVFLCAAFLVLGFAVWSVWEREPAKAFGGNFAPMQQLGGARYQIAGCDAKSAWIVDTGTGDVYLIYANGKWKEVGSIQDEKQRMKK